MITYRTDITVNRPAGEIFPYLSDITRFPSWMGGHTTQALTDGPMQVGFWYRYRTDEGTFEMEVTGYDPNRGTTSRTLAGPFHWEGTFTLEPLGDATTRVVSAGEMQFGGLMRLAQPFLGGEIRKREQAELVRLKALAEGAA